MATHRGSPPRAAEDASASAASFALATSAASSRSFTVSCSPGRRPADDSPTSAASGLTVTTELRRACSMVRRTVISFVRLAIGTLARALCASRISPVAPFSTSQARPETCGPAPSAAGTTSTSAAAAAATTALTKRRLYLRPSAHANALAHPQGVRAYVRVEDEERVHRGVEAKRDVAQRFARLQVVEARPVPCGRRAGARRGGRRDRRRRRRRLRLQTGADEQDRDRDRGQERNRSRVALQLGPRAVFGHVCSYQPETAQTSRLRRADSSAAAVRQSSPEARKA